MVFMFIFWYIWNKSNFGNKVASLIAWSLKMHGNALFRALMNVGYPSVEGTPFDLMYFFFNDFFCSPLTFWEDHDRPYFPLFACPGHTSVEVLKLFSANLDALGVIYIAHVQ